MSLKAKIQQDMKDAMRAKDSVRLESIRMLRAAIQRKEVDERLELDDEAVLMVVQKMIKQNRDAAEQFTKGNRTDLADKENAGIEVLQTYLPKQLSDDQIKPLIEQALAETGASEMKDMGKVMAWLKSKIQGQADMGKVSGMIKSRLSG